MNLKPDIIYNTHGKFVDNVFFEMVIPLFEVEIRNSYPLCHIVLPEQAGMEGQYSNYREMWLEDVGETSYTKRHFVIHCDGHGDMQYVLESAKVEIHIGHPHEFISNNTSDHFGIVKKTARQILQETPFRGVRFVDPQVIYMQDRTDLDNIPMYVLFAPYGKIQGYPMQLNKGVSNSCRQCGYLALYCEKCGYIHRSCPGCGASPCTTDSNIGDIKKVSMLFEARSATTYSLWGKSWDGSDFCYYNTNIITKRVLDWLLSVQAKPFCARPVRVCVDGMSSQQLEWLERAQQSI